MGWGGSVSAMIQSLKNNKELLGSKREYHRTKVKVLQSSEKLKIKYKEATPEQLRTVRAKVKQERLFNKLKTVIVILVLSPLIFIVGRSCWNVIKEEIPKSEGQILMDFYSEIKIGDNFFMKNKFEKAVVFYESAEVINPHSKEVKIRMGIVSTIECLYENENCGHAAWIVNFLEKRDSLGVNVLKLKKLLFDAYELNNPNDTAIIIEVRRIDDNIFDFRN